MFLSLRLCTKILYPTRIQSNYFLTTKKYTNPTRKYALVKPYSIKTNTFSQTLRRLYSNNVAGSVGSSVVSGVVTKPNKLIGYWLLGCSGMVFGAVVLGGVTRLTESGLSMVTWKLLGERWPKNNDEWLAEFKKYQQYPEFQIKNANMTVEEFKFIFFMEYAHRMWGRCIGAVYAIPAIYFWSRGHFNSSMKKRVLLFGALIGVQGLMGWYMVKSGLENRFHEPDDVPRVSQYRLASHLTFAFILYYLFLSSSLTYILPTASAAAAASGKQITSSPATIKSLYRLAHMTKGMILFTAISGAFVAGLDAGLVYNSFPKMADRWIPSDLLAFEPMIRNFTENPTTVQFDHRMMGITTISLISTLWWMARKGKLPRRAYYAVSTVMAAGWLQIYDYRNKVTLGITTLLTYVPVPLAASHQSGSLILLSSIIWLTHELKLLKYIPK